MDPDYDEVSNYIQSESSITLIDYVKYQSIECLDCIGQSFYSAFNLISLMLIVNLCLKLVLQLVKRIFTSEKKEIVGRCLILIVTVILMYFSFSNGNQEGKESIPGLLTLQLVIYCLSGILLLNWRRNLTGNRLWYFTVTSILLNEIFIHFDFTNQIKLRTHLMCLTMKLIAMKSTLKSIVNDDERTPPNWLFQVTYLIHPQSLPFGGYFPPNLETSIDHYSKIPLLKQTINPLIASFTFLFFSNCFIEIFNSFGEIMIDGILTTFLPSLILYSISELFAAYCSAFEFRSSHYFICFLLQFNHNFWGSEIIVTKPSMIEFPRSLVDVAIAWDIPTHQWLKQYVYIPCKNKFGFGLSILATYLFSSFIHGFRVEIWLVLFSLGILTWAETKIRNIFASSWDSCISAKSCSYMELRSNEKINLNYFTIFLNHFKSFFGYTIDQPNCTRNHQSTPFNSIWMLIVNFGFSLLAIVHLAYLGSPFHPDEKERTFKHVFNNWYALGFFSHGISLIFVMIYSLVK